MTGYGHLREILMTWKRGKNNCALKIKPVIAKLAKENQKLSDGRGQKGCQISDNLNVDTKKEIAKAAGVSHDTIAKVEKIEEKAAPEIKADRNFAGSELTE